jgi:general secretion pathway protein C
MPEIKPQIQSGISWLFSLAGLVWLFGKVCLVAAVGFCHAAAMNLGSAGEIEIPVEDSTQELESLAGGPDARITDYAIITRRNIFGAKPKSASKTPVKASTSSFDVRLVATSIGDGSTPFAIIEDTKKKEQEIFELNENVFGQARLVAVLETSVSLDRNGKVEVLELAEGDGSAGAPSTSSGGITAIDDNQTEFSIPEAELENALGNLPQLLSQARAVPYFRNGKSIGMRLFAIRRGSMYEKLGLKNGDILKAVNGNSMSDPAQALKLFEQLKNERNIDATLERAGKDVDMRYSIE